MIYTFTLNPSLDYIMEIDDIEVGGINRSRSEILKAGGKGINVTTALKELGIKSMACGFVAGTVGRSIVEELNKNEVSHNFIEVKGCSRINVKLKCKKETAINGSGCMASVDDIDKLCLKIKSMDNDYIVLSGSVCRGIGDNIYAYIMKKVKGRFIVDASGDLLTNTLKYKPFLIKPNHIELGEIFNREIAGFKDGIYYGKRLWEMGAQNVIVSMGKMGAVFVNGSEEYIIKSEGVDAKNTVGAGDTMVAGFLYKYISGEGYRESLQFAVRLAEDYLKR